MISVKSLGGDFIVEVAHFSMLNEVVAVARIDQ